MVQYIRGPDGLVHVVNPSGGGDFTFCDRDFTESDEETQSFAGIVSKGPATCSFCKSEIKDVAASIKGVRFKKSDTKKGK